MAQMMRDIPFAMVMLVTYEGMKASLISRELIADSIELVTRANYFDGVIAISSCDKTIPGTIDCTKTTNKEQRRTK